MNGIRRRALQRIIIQLEELKELLEGILEEDALRQEDLLEDMEDSERRELEEAACDSLLGSWEDLYEAITGTEDAEE